MLAKFTKKDPTLRVHVDAETKQTIMSGMGELHLEIICDRMMREFKVECDIGPPQVAYREAITRTANIEHTHKKQSGGSGQFGKGEGFIEPSDDEVIGAPGGEFKSELTDVREVIGEEVGVK